MQNKWKRKSENISRPPAKWDHITRRQFFSMAALGGGAALFSACGIKPTSPFKGYSIFQDTMVQMPWTEIKQAIQDEAIVLLPVGIIEEHGPQMGLAVDIYKIVNWLQMTRRALATRMITALIAPPMYWGVSRFVSNYPGTFSVKNDTMKQLLIDIHESLNSWGVKYVFSFNAHGDSTHNQVYQEAIKEAHDRLEMGAYLVCAKGTEVLDEKYALFIENAPLTESMLAHWDIHAGAAETAQMVAYFPEEVDTTMAKTLKPSTEFAPNGYWGDPASYDQISTREIITWAEAVAEKTADAIESFLKAQVS